jgi:hypothetical protein
MRGIIYETIASGSQGWTIGWTSKLGAFKHYTRPFNILNARPIGAGSINAGGLECNLLGLWVGLLVTYADDFFITNRAYPGL